MDHRGTGADEGDRALVAQVAKGDAAAHRVLFDRYYPRVFGFVGRRIDDHSLVEEITVDVFFEIWRAAADFRGDAKVSTWIFGIAHFKSLAARRGLRRGKRSAVVAAEDERLQAFADERDLERDIGARDELRIVKRLLERLPDGQRRALELAFMEGLPYAEIARRLEISEDTVKTRIARGRARLRADLRRRNLRES